jgi:hypothetical protein
MGVKLTPGDKPSVQMYIFSQASLITCDIETGEALLNTIKLIRYCYIQNYIKCLYKRNGF